jgi:hypothetical protein
MTQGSRSAQSRRPNNEVRLLLRRLELLSNLPLNPLLVAFRCVYRAVHVFVGISQAALKLGPERNCGVDLTFSSLSFALCVFMLFFHLRQFETGSRQE